jgi:multidrug efflux system membrane fusion protein
MNAFPASSPLFYPSRRIAFGIMALGTFVLAVGCHRAPGGKQSKAPPEVIVELPVPDDVIDYQDFTGRIDALKTVDIRPRVSGYITEAPFTEGETVKEGQLLFQIDPRTYQDDLNSADANLKQAEADLVLQTKRAERGIRLINSGTGAIGPEDYDQLIAARDKAKATVNAMKAARDRAKLFLDFTRVTVPALTDDEGKPLRGRISRRQVDPGNLVNADQTILTTLVSVDRMYAYFDVDERTYLELASITSQGSSSWFSALRFPVLMRLANEEEFTHKGYVNFLDNRLNANTGTVRMRGVFDNPRELLKSGLFVRIRLPVGTPYKTLLIPDEAIMSDQGKKYIYVVEKETNDKGEEIERVKYRSVKLGESLGTLRAIKEGLKEGELVVVSGLQKVRDKAEVHTKARKSSKAPDSKLIQMLKEEQSASSSTKASSPVSADLKDKGSKSAASPNEDMPSQTTKKNGRSKDAGAE